MFYYPKKYRVEFNGVLIELVMRDVGCCKRDECDGLMYVRGGYCGLY